MNCDSYYCKLDFTCCIMLLLTILDIVLDYCCNLFIPSPQKTYGTVLITIL